MGVLSYLVATTGLPVADDLLARGDRVLGLDWPGWFAFVQQRPVLERVLHLAYMSALPQIAIITSYLGLTGQRRGNSEFFWTLTISLLIIIPISGLLPAFSAVVYYGVPGFRDHMADFVALRVGRFDQLDLSRLQGLISFPSFHTTLAVLFPYVVRRRRVALLIAALVNGAMIVAIPTEGSHYFVDVLAGAAVAALAIAATARIEALLERRRPQPVLAAAE
jgi:membrane-associated phospholipid phosphatase